MIYDTINIQYLQQHKLLTKSGKITPRYKLICVGDVLTNITNRTNFLTTDASIIERLYNIIQNKYHMPLCTCGNPLKFRLTGRYRLTYTTFCSHTCSNNDNNVKLLKEKKSIKHYGVSNISQSDEIKNKKKQTNLNKRGVEYSLQDPTIREQIKQTNLELYGFESPLQSPNIKEKAKQTNLKKYGSENPFGSNLIKEKIKQTNLEVYGFERPLQLHEIKEKAKQTNLEKYGVESKTQQHITESLQYLNSKNWLNEQHITNKRTLLDISNELKCNDSTVGKYLHSHGLETQYFFQSTGEKELLTFINSCVHNTISNTRKIIPPYELDIYLPEHNLAIEYCGLYWHSEQQGKDKQYHKRKHNLCKEKGIQLITLFEDEWIYKQEQVKNKILSLLNKSNQKRIFARKTSIIELSTKQKQEFFNTNHIQGNGPGSINLGLEYEGTLVACMSFIKQKHQHYLNRYATSCQISGGFSKLLKHFQNNYEWQHLISFADLRWSNGNLYEKNGWKLDSILPPDYYYIKQQTRIHKFNYRRKYLPKLLNEFNPDLSEKENCDNNKIPRIWDCGKLRYTITNS